MLKATPHNSRLTAQAPLRRLRNGICVAKMLDNVGLRYPHRASGAKVCDRCPCFGSLFPPLAALTFAASSIICAFGLASAASRSPYRHLELCGIALRILNDTTKKHRTKICLVLFGAPAGIRIPDTLIKSQVLYQLSYGYKYSICLLQLKYCNRYGRKSQAFCRIFSQKICRRAAGAGT